MKPTQLTNFRSSQSFRVPLYLSHISAGFPSPAQDYIEDELDLNKMLITNPPATFEMKVVGWGMVGAGIFPNDILIIDRSLKPTHRRIVVVVWDGEFLIRRYLSQGSSLHLLEENGKSTPIKISEHDDIIIWGVVTYAIRRFDI